MTRGLRPLRLRSPWTLRAPRDGGAITLTAPRPLRGLVVMQARFGARGPFAHPKIFPQGSGAAL